MKPYLARLTRAELFMVMVCGMATIAGTVMALYGAILGPVVPDAIGHILVASIVATPAAIIGRRADGARPHDPRGERGHRRARTRARWTPSRAARSRAWGW